MCLPSYKKLGGVKMNSIPLRPLDILSHQQLAELSEPSNTIAAQHLSIRVVCECILFWGAVQLADAGSLLFFPVFIVCGIWHSFWGYAGIGHELYHARVFSSRGLNFQLFRLASYLTLNNPKFFEESHSLHHRNTFSERDFEAYSRQSWRARDFFWYATVDLPLLIKRVVYIFTNSIGYVHRGARLESTGVGHQREALGIISLHLLVHGLIILLIGDPLVNLLFLFLPVTCLLPSRVLAQAQHLGLADMRNQGPLRHSRTLALPRVVQFLYAGMNFHAEHHLIPRVPYYRLPQLNAILKERGLVRDMGLIQFLRGEFFNLVRHQSG